MAAATRFTSTTLKPIPDKWIAVDGAGVVLNATPEELIVLRYFGDKWEVTRHASRPDPAALNEWEWRGTRYDASGASLARLTEQDPPERWSWLYRELLAV